MRARGLVAALALVLSASACTDDEPDPPSQHVPAGPAAIDAVWSADLGPAAHQVPRDSLLGFRPHGELDTWGVGDTLVVVGRRGLEAFDAATGDPAWTLRVPARLGTVCAASEQPNADGVGGLLFSRNRACDVAGAVDLTTGRLLWSAVVEPGPYALRPRYAVRPVQMGEETLAVEVPCEEVRRYDLATGRVLPALVPRVEDCSHTVAVGHGLVAIADKDADTLAVFDQDSGRRRWQHPLQGGVEAVVSDDPLVLGVSLNGHHVLQRYDERGRPDGFVGRQADSAQVKLLGPFDDLAVASYSNGSLGTPLFRGFDLRSGAQRWRGDGLLVAGEQAGRLFELFRPFATSQVWIGRADPQDPVATRVALGSLPEDDPLSTTYGWTDSVLVRQVGTTIEVFALPDPATDDDGEPMPEIPTTTPAPAWGDGDVRPADVIDLCTRIRPRSIASLGFRSADLPVPAPCTWHDVLDDPDADRVLSVEVFAVAPADGSTAAEEAHAQFAEQPEADINWPARVRPLPGLGDEAQYAQKRTATESESRLSVRTGNVMLVLHSDVRTDDGRPPSLASLLAGQRRVLADLTAALDEVAPDR
jgi:hypothetical protein